MPTSKPDTSGGFDPKIPGGMDTTAPSIAALRLDGKLDRSILSPRLHLVLLGIARVRNAVSSFRMEGERVELDRARDLVLAGNPETPSETGVLKLANAYRDLADGRLPDFSTKGVVRAHELLFTGVLSRDIVGRLKTSQNTITDVTETVVKFYPTPPNRVRQELDALFRWLDRSAGTLLPSVAAALFFAEFEAIHPFANGNGRLGRYLNLALLRKLGMINAPLVPLDTRFFRTSDQYYESLASTNAGQSYFLWTRYYAKELRRAYELAASRGDLRRALDGFSKPSTRALLSWVLSGSGEWFHRGDYPNRPKYSGPALWGALQELVRAGILESHGEAKGRQYRLKSDFLAGTYGRRI